MARARVKINPIIAGAIDDVIMAILRNAIQSGRTVSFEQLRDAVNEPLSRLDSGYRFRERHGRVRPNLVISNGLEIISLRQEPRQFPEARFIPRQPRKLDVNPVVRFGHLTDALEDQRLRGMERREVSGATCAFRKLDTGDRSTLVQRLPCLVEITLRLRSQKSTPSRRISSINGVRSP